MQDGVKRKQSFRRCFAAESDHFRDLAKMVYTPTEWRFCSDFFREYKYNREIAKAMVEHIPGHKIRTRWISGRKTTSCNWPI